jgi:hypothetical protein
MYDALYSTMHKIDACITGAALHHCLPPCPDAINRAKDAVVLSNLLHLYQPPSVHCLGRGGVLLCFRSPLQGWKPRRCAMLLFGNDGGAEFEWIHGKRCVRGDVAGTLGDLFTLVRLTGDFLLTCASDPD